MSINKIATAAALSAGLALPAASQELPDLFEQITSIEGDVTSTGVIDVSVQDIVRFHPEGHFGGFPVKFAVDRDTLRKVKEHCSLKRGAYNSDNFCTATIKAGVSVDGASINLLIFDIQNLQPPKGKI